MMLCVLILFSCSNTVDVQEKQDENIQVMAYYVARDGYEPKSLPLDKLTHIIFSFTEVIDNEMKFKREDAGEKLRALSAEKSNYPGLKVMIACGGWGGSGGFSDMARDPELRKKFVDSSIQFVKAHTHTHTHMESGESNSSMHIYKFFVISSQKDKDTC